MRNLNVPNNEILGAQQAYMKKLRFSSRPETKFSGLWHPGTFRAQPCSVVPIGIDYISSLFIIVVDVI